MMPNSFLLSCQRRLASRSIVFESEQSERGNPEKIFKFSGLLRSQAPSQRLDASLRWHDTTLFILLLSLFSLTAHATIYKTVQPNGVILFSDTPTQNSQEMHVSELKKLNSFTMPSTSSAPSSATDLSQTNSSSAAPASHPTQAYSLTITSPVAGTFLQQGQAPFIFTATLHPALSSEQMANGSVMLFIYDATQPDKPTSLPGNLSSDGHIEFSTDSLSTGELSLVARLISNSNQTVLAESAPMTIFFKPINLPSSALRAPSPRRGEGISNT